MSRVALVVVALVTLACRERKPAPPPPVEESAPVVAAEEVLSPMPVSAPQATPAPASGQWTPQQINGSAPANQLCGGAGVDESVAFSCANDLAFRQGETLFVRLQNGRVLAHGESIVPGASAYFKYRGLLRGSNGARSFHLLERSNGESSHVQAIEVGSGEVVTLAAMPVMSPNGEHFVVNAVDVDVCAELSRFSIWRATSGRPEREWAASAPCAAASRLMVRNAAWRSAESLAATVSRQVTRNDGSVSWVDMPAGLALGPGGWVAEGWP